jgi:hypothetical protein
MEEPTRLNNFVIWQRSVLLAADLLKLRRNVPERDQRFADDLVKDAIHLAGNVADNYLSEEDDGFGWSFPAQNTATVYTQIKIAELAGVIPEAEARKLLAQCDDLGRMLANYRRSQKEKAQAMAADRASGEGWGKRDGFKPLSGSKYPRPGTGK